MVFETRTNQLFVTDIPSKLEEIQALIAKIDIPVRQVLIESRIVIADDTFGRSLGVRLGAVDLRGVRGGIPGYSVGGNNYASRLGGNLNAVAAQTLQTGGDVPFADTAFVNLPATGANGFDPATFAFSLFGAAANRFLNLEISALEADGKGKVVSSPRVVTADQQKALIEQGEELPYQVATSSGATSLQFRKANLKLEVTPQVTPEGNVILDVDVTKDSVGRATTRRLRDQHQAREDAGAGRERRHRRDRRHLRAERSRRRHQGAVPRRRSLPRQPVQDADDHVQDRAADLPDAEDRHRPHRGALSALSKACEPRMKKVANL